MSDDPDPHPTLDYQPPGRERWDPATRRHRWEAPFALLFIAGLLLVAPFVAVVPAAYAEHNGPARLFCCGVPALLGLACVAADAVGFHWAAGDDDRPG